MSFTPSRRVDGVLKADTYSPSSSINTVCVSGRVPMAFSMSKYCVMSSKSTTSFDEAPLICSLLVKSLIEFLRPSTTVPAVSARALARLSTLPVFEEELRLASEAASSSVRDRAPTRTIKPRQARSDYARGA